MHFSLDERTSNEGGSGGVEIALFSVGVATFSWVGRAFTNSRRKRELEKRYAELDTLGPYGASDPDDSCLYESQGLLVPSEEEKSADEDAEEILNTDCAKPRELQKTINVFEEARNEVKELEEEEELKDQIGKINEANPSIYLKTCDSDVFMNMNRETNVMQTMPTQVTRIESFDLELSHPSVSDTFSGSMPAPLKLGAPSDSDTMSIPESQEICTRQLIPFEVDYRDFEVHREYNIISLFTQCCCTSLGRFCNIYN